MRCRFPRALLLLLALGCFGISAQARTKIAAGVSGGMGFYSGDSTRSFAGGNLFFAGAQGEIRNWMVSPILGMNFGYGVGLANVGGTQYSADMIHADFILGLKIKPFTDARFEPYIDIAGISGWELMRLGTTGDIATTSSYTYGGMVTVGIDVRKNVFSNAFRIFSGYAIMYGSQLAGQSGFDLTNIRFGIGWVFSSSD